MASEVEICNLALSSLGDDAAVSSINPPEGSTQAELCGRFYPQARDATLSAPKVAWGFATTRVHLAPLSVDPLNGQYAYGLPAGCMRALRVHPPGMDELHQHDFSIRHLDGVAVLVTPLEDAELDYIARVTDSGQFPALFVDALTWNLAARLAGPLIKGTEGAKMAQTCRKYYEVALSEAARTDANQGRRYPKYQPASIRARA